MLTAIFVIPGSATGIVLLLCAQSGPKIINYKIDFMTRWFLSVLLIFLIPAVAFCQQPVIEVQNSGGRLYLEHTVTPKENFYSIGRLYNVSPRELAAYNQLNMEQGLNIGQHLKIPLDKNNFTQSTSKNAAEALVPLYHMVQPDETLFRIGVDYKNVQVSSLKKWNHLAGDQVNNGTPLIVGYLKVSKTESPLANAKFDVPSKNLNQVVTKSTKVAPVENTVSKEAPKQEIKEEPKTIPDNQISQGNVKSNSQTIDEGFFKKQFTDHATTGNVASANVTTTVFKSTSGWQDKKYYCFNNEATPGTILKISVPGTGNAVYAKVLDAIPDIKQNEGVQLVLSNAAASSLGINDEKFSTTISFIK